DGEVAGDAPGAPGALLVGVPPPAARLAAAFVVAHPRRRRHDAARRALEQLDPERALDGGDMLRDPGLRGVLALGRARERALLADGDDGANLSQGDVGHGSAIRKADAPAQNILFRPREPRG